MDKSFVQKRMMEYAKASPRSLSEISKKMGHRGNYISNAASGRFEPKLDEVLYFCELLDISPADFFTEEPLTYDQQEAIALLRQLDSSDVKLIIPMLKRLLAHKTKRF